MTMLTCVNCRAKFYRENGYSGSLDAPYCLKSVCLKAYLSAAAALVNGVASLPIAAAVPGPLWLEAVNGFDVEQYRDQQLRGKKG